MLLTVVREEERVVEVKLTKTTERAARRKATAKKAAKVAVEAAKFEKDAWKKPQKWEYEELKAPVQDDGYYSHHAYTLNRRTEGISFIELHHKREYVFPEEDMVTLEEVLIAVVKADYYAIAAETAERLFPTYGHKYPCEKELIRSIVKPDVEMARDIANSLGREWEEINGKLPVINAFKYFGEKRLAKILAEDEPEWVSDVSKYEKLEAYDTIF